MSAHDQNLWVFRANKADCARSELHLCPHILELSQLQCLFGDTFGGTFYALGQFLLSESMQPWNDSRGNDRVLWKLPLPDNGVPLTMLSAAPIRICPSHRSPSMCQYSLHFLHTKHTHWPCLRAYATSRSKFTPIGLWFGPNFHQTLHIAGSVSKFGTLKAIVS